MAGIANKNGYVPKPCCGLEFVIPAQAGIQWFRLKIQGTSNNPAFISFQSEPYKPARLPD
ncbi:hypothetical protein [Chitinilyticum litopenaei]|uniref:hypothetical protein n=1 Tax=Chitinilyticum litopenaei TaxID=1121276 RepID=UPI0011864541|nr:hypothetical protein [Chitinilyticum litopenaei]